MFARTKYTRAQREIKMRRNCFILVMGVIRCVIGKIIEKNGRGKIKSD